MRFHPHHNVYEKEYHYLIYTQRPNPFEARFGWYVGASLDIDCLQKCLAHVVGTHDFRSFCTGNQYDDTTRTITSATVLSVTLPTQTPAYRIVITGPSFLYKMVRRVVGAALYTATHPSLSSDTYYAIFTQKNPLHALVTAPAHGLTLHHIIYHTAPVEGPLLEALNHDHTHE
jgi:tRNA pseudouridine38-40 synthase